MSKTYPTGTRFENWIVVKDGAEYRVRRHVTYPDGKKVFERYPPKPYRHLVTDPEELRRWVTRNLNGDDPDKLRARELAEIKHAFISPEFLNDYYEDYLRPKIPAAKDAQTLNKYLREYGIHFFVTKLGLADPLDWKRHEHLWARSLLNTDPDMPPELRIFPEKRYLAGKVLRQIVFEMNRFLAFLHNQRPSEVPPLLFAPLSRVQITNHDAMRKLLGEVDSSKYVSNEDWLKIEQALEGRDIPWRFPIQLAYYYGLRRNEALGLEPTSLRRDYLFVQKQLDYYARDKENPENDSPVFKPVKDREERRVPHWFGDPAKTYQLIQETAKMRMHPDQLSTYFTEFTRELFEKKAEYNIDDLRPTFLTNALAKLGSDRAEEVRLAAGHSNLQTTFKHYVKDTRKLGDEVWTPKGAA